MTINLTLTRVAGNIGHSSKDVCRAIENLVDRYDDKIISHELTIEKSSLAKWVAPRLVLILTTPNQQDKNSLHDINELSEALYHDALRDPILERLVLGEGGQALMIKLSPKRIETPKPKAINSE